MFGWLAKPVTLISTIALSSLSLLSKRYQRVRYGYHLLIYVSTLGALSIWGVVVSVLASVTGQRLNINYYVARSFYNVCSPLINIRFIVEGEEHLTGLLRGGTDGQGQSAVLVGNHQSFLDILYLGRIFPRHASIMAKKELKWAPLLGQYLALSGAVFVDRKNRDAARLALEQAGDNMKKRQISLWVFPEGTRTLSAEPTLKTFKKGAFHLAIQAKVPVVPVVCENYHRLFDGKSRLDEGVLRIRVLPAITTEGMGPDDVSALTQSTREKMVATLREISAPGPLGRGPARDVPPLEKLPSEQQLGQPTEGRRRSSDDGSVADSQNGDSRNREEGQWDSTTEDEMDDDAVLLKKPTGSVNV
ncbi:putative 1-acylglycerol-3-phosphate O-acyltransferase [Kockovaella imperatae]|uniref:1-acyl-sn-glycerol-3-phosphate acyltransferase n=1 Tax=Kockovaella imperatae TaxID=4999 RepID=A0A1Y1UAG2_9TREE|nr:putative 1-acylglycerol-3-phosphate O-acyltransferase [Kockovaella imperatae]ORX35002.1 putative 1-acylglycerol-3-phosphate O-acyltransferase [Kockovaella imperatae]